MDSVFNSALRSHATTQVPWCFSRLGDTVFLTFRSTAEGFFVEQEELHSGIIVNKKLWAEFRRYEADITRMLDEHPDARVLVFAGHSLGGALAQIAAAFYGSMLERPYRIVCHTFGSPRVGNKMFVRWFTDAVDENIRVQNSRDPMAHRPFGALWVHTTDMAWELSEDLSGRIKRVDTPWYKRISKYARSDWDDHDCKVYIERLED